MREVREGEATGTGDGVHVMLLLLVSGGSAAEELRTRGPAAALCCLQGELNTNQTESAGFGRQPTTVEPRAINYDRPSHPPHNAPFSGYSAGPL